MYSVCLCLCLRADVWRWSRIHRCIGGVRAMIARAAARANVTANLARRSRLARDRDCRNCKAILSAIRRRVWQLPCPKLHRALRQPVDKSIPAQHTWRHSVCFTSSMRVSSGCSLNSSQRKVLWCSSQRPHISLLTWSACLATTSCTYWMSSPVQPPTLCSAVQWTSSSRRR